MLIKTRSCEKNGVPNGIRTRVIALKGRRPGPARRWGHILKVALKKNFLEPTCILNNLFYALSQVFYQKKSH